MKKLSIIVLAMLLNFYAIAQNNEFYYKDFVPDTCQFITNDSLKVDIDNDGAFDMWISGYVQHGALLCVIHMMPGWEICPSEGNTILNSDTLVWKRQEQFYNHTVFTGEYFQKNIGFRHQVGDMFSYGWMFTYCDYKLDPNIIGRNVYVDKMAYCAIPDYPLQWGQTSLTGVEEDTGTALVAIHPNPANDSFTLTGEQIAEARLYSVTGQLVATKPGNGTESLTVDVSDLPSGLYFVTAIGEDGSRSVLKVVKE